MPEKRDDEVDDDDDNVEDDDVDDDDVMVLPCNVGNFEFNL